MISFTNGTFRFLANERCYFGRNQFTLLQSVIVTYTNIVHASKCSIYQHIKRLRRFSFIEMYIVCTLLLFRVYNSLTLVMYSKYLVEQFNFDHVAFEESSYSRCSDFCSIYFTKCCVNIACIVPA